MIWFNLPSQCVFEKKVPINTLLSQISNKNTEFQNLVRSCVESLMFYACLKESTYPINCLKQNDSYLDEVLFFLVLLNKHINIDQLAKNIFRALKYQTVVVFQYGDEYCLAAGIVRDARKITGNRKVEHYRISPWFSCNEIVQSNLFNIERLSKKSYESIYLSIYSAIRDINDERYITLSFAADLYAYTHGMDEAIGWPGNMDIQKKLKERFPGNRIKSKSGTEVYRFSEDEVYKMIASGYADGEDLIEVIFNFREYEDDFDLPLPERLQDAVDDYEAAYYDAFNRAMKEDYHSIDYHEWLDE